MDKKLYNELLESIEEAGQIKKGKKKPARITKFDSVDIHRLRKQVGASQSKFARMIGVSERTLQNWEQGRRSPQGPARALLKVFNENPKAVVKALS
jgi:putative transcriptional regulator